MSSHHVTGHVYTDWDGVLDILVVIIGEERPLMDLSVYGCLWPGECLSDQIMYESINFLNHGHINMSMSDERLMETLLGKNDFQRDKGI